MTSIAHLAAPSELRSQPASTAEPSARASEAVRQAGVSVASATTTIAPKDVVVTPTPSMPKEPAGTPAPASGTQRDDLQASPLVDVMAKPIAAPLGFPSPTLAATPPGAKAAIDSAPASATPASTPASPAAPATASAVVATSVSVPRPANESPIEPPVLAPADAVAMTAAAPRSVVTTTRVDPRTVVSVKSSESIEPLYAVPIPATVRLARPTAADSIVVYKRERTLILYNRGVPVRSYFVALGSKPVGDKERAGDQKTPEGVFRITAHNPASKFHLALRLSYPTDTHRARAAALGVDPGGDIMIHGLPKEFSQAGKDHRQNDWTNGCVALSNQEIEEIWHAVPDGTPVQIKP
ncbi:MAG TPA: L,D-transpeptidase family protein [Gemmatimonadaceae bacterium]|nr:L,D-transpeptidase family protein [Gemmatimonadaceae bacterium]